MKRVTRIELATEAWEASVLVAKPLNPCYISTFAIPILTSLDNSLGS